MTYPAIIVDENGDQTAGNTIEFTDPDNQPTGPGSSPDADGNTNPILIKTGDSASGDAGDITLLGGDAGDGQAGSVVLQGGQGDDDGTVKVKAPDGTLALSFTGAGGAGAVFTAPLTAPGLSIDGTATGTDFTVGTTAWDILNASGGEIMQWQDLGTGIPGLGFYGTAAVAKPVVPLTTPLPQDIIDALVALGLVSQSD